MGIVAAETAAGEHGFSSIPRCLPLTRLFTELHTACIVYPFFFSMRLRCLRRDAALAPLIPIVDTFMDSKRHLQTFSMGGVELGAA